jgi:hypothetical protein
MNHTKNIQMRPIFFFLLFLMLSCENEGLNTTSLLGEWGTEKDNSLMHIENDRIHFDFTCAAAEITSGVPQNHTNPFVLTGTYNQQFGNIPDDFDPTKYIFPAQFKFTQSGNQLSVVITLSQDNSKIGTFTYDKNLKVLVKKCP